ncbi:GntR family transcriptional regulator [Clostridia bacterium]|nr:GntR family transcriptional regulator [Clostridia bacterium]
MFTLNFQSREPLHEQLYNGVLRLVSSGVLEPEEKLPPVRTLAVEQGINPNTVAKAYSNLEKDGVIYSVVGKGSFVSSDISAINKKREIVMQELWGTIKNAAKMGISEQEIIKLIKAVFSEGEKKHD